MTWTQTLRERWWLAPIAILLVAAAIVIRIITTPLEVSANEFQFRPKMQANTSYHVSIKDAQNPSGRTVSSGFSFKTEPAPAIADVKVNRQKVTDGQQALKPTGSVQI